MYGPTFYGSRYWGRRYFGAGGSLPVPYPTLPRAIIERFMRTKYSDMLPGGLHYPDAPNTAKKNPPYGVIQRVTKVPVYNTWGVSYYEDHLQVSFFGPLGSSAELSAIEEGWYSVFSPGKLLENPILWDGYRLVRFANSDARVMEDDTDAPAGPGKASLPSIQTIIEFLVIYSPRAN
jgi:hypothetical protein